MGLKLTKGDAGRGLSWFHTRQGTLPETFERLRSVQFDPLQPVGSTHDLVLQARVKGYKIGDWEKAAYRKRLIYDGWDKQASLVPYSGWGARRIFHKWHAAGASRIFDEYPHAVEAVLEELARRGPLIPRDFEFQELKPEWRGSWHGPNLTKQTLRSLWHRGMVMTHSRKGGHHVYDLTERVVPKQFLAEPEMTEHESLRAILADRYEAVGLLRPNPNQEVWGVIQVRDMRRPVMKELLAEGRLIEVDVDGVAAYASPAFLEALEEKAPNRVTFFGPLDQIMWDRTMIKHVFGFDYLWEVYKPEHLRQWGYYVLPVMYGDRFVARFDVWSRAGVLQVKAWHWEPGVRPTKAFWGALEKGMLRFMEYAGASEVSVGVGVEARVGEFLGALRRG